jgi:hypothetical protein
MAFVAILVLAAALFILVGRWRRAAPDTARKRDANRRRDDGCMILPIDVPVSGDDSSPGNGDFNPGGGDFGGAGSSGNWGDSEGSDSSDGGGDGNGD